MVVSSMKLCLTSCGASFQGDGRIDSMAVSIVTQHYEELCESLIDKTMYRFCVYLIYDPQQSEELVICDGLKLGPTAL